MNYSMRLTIFNYFSLLKFLVVANTRFACYSDDERDLNYFLNVHFNPLLLVLNDV